MKSISQKPLVKIFKFDDLKIVLQKSYQPCNRRQPLADIWKVLTRREYPEQPQASTLHIKYISTYPLCPGSGVLIKSACISPLDDCFASLCAPDLGRFG